MKIQVWDWSCASSARLEKSGHKYGDVIEGTVDDAFRIAREIYDTGLNVMVKHCGGGNVGTRKKPVIEPESILIGVDTQRFQQR